MTLAKITYPEKQVERLRATTTPIGLWQHSQGSEPEQAHGYSIDDQARALITLARLSKSFPEAGIDEEHSETYLKYFENAKRKDGWFRNYFKPLEGGWIEGDPDNLQDCYGRTIWALTEFASAEKYPEKQRDKAKNLLSDSLEKATELKYLHSKAFTLLGLTKILKTKNGASQFPKVASLTEKLAAELHQRYIDSSSEEWKWFEDTITYCSARIPEAMIKAGKIIEGKIPSEDLYISGIMSLGFLIKTCFDRDVFHAIGNNGWYARGGKKPKFDEQTIEAGAMTNACVTAYTITENAYFKTAAENSFAWFHRKNQKRISMLDKASGGVYDAITSGGANINQGAESLLSYLLASCSIARLQNLK